MSYSKTEHLEKQTFLGELPFSSPENMKPGGCVAFC